MIDTFFSRLPRPASQDGFTLIELLVASVLALIVFGAILSTLESSQQVQARDTEWALTMQEGRAGLARMAQEIRESSEALKEAKPNRIVFLASIGGTAWEIKYDCSVAQAGTEYHECVRYAAEKGKSLPSTGTPVIRGLLNTTEAFCYSHGASASACVASPNSTEQAEATVATLKVELPAKGTLKQAGSSGYTHSVVLENAAFMRNLDPEG
ncbi:MAG TPA: prepilin-type N-terminal cleavage/methylation domain-containing protein [Solirubrobacteraceae bacterium]|jgi:prepilin-type N-terminal cleavage/methylation domain-containing protein